MNEQFKKKMNHKILHRNRANVQKRMKNTLSLLKIIRMHKKASFRKKRVVKNHRIYFELPL